jgi:hypothetical protein
MILVATVVSHATIVIRVPITPVSETAAVPIFTTSIIGAVAVIAVVGDIAVERNAVIEVPSAIAATFIPSDPIGVSTAATTAMGFSASATTAHQLKLW